MARKVVVTVVDDYDGRSPAVETVSFGMDGVGYEIDLSEENAALLREVFAEWTPFGRQVGRVGRRRSKPVEPSGARKPEAGVVRKWARANGFEVPSRGRVPSEVVAAYEKAAS